MSDEQTVNFMGAEIKVLGEELKTLDAAMNGLKHEKYNINKEEKEIKKLEKLVNHIKKEIQELQRFIVENMTAMRKDPKLIEQIIDKYIEIHEAYLTLHNIFAEYGQSFKKKADAQLKSQPLYSNLEREYNISRELMRGIQRGLFGSESYANYKKEDLIQQFKRTQFTHA